MHGMGTAQQQGATTQSTITEKGVGMTEGGIVLDSNAPNVVLSWTIMP